MIEPKVGPREVAQPTPGDPTNPMGAKVARANAGNVVTPDEQRPAPQHEEAPPVATKNQRKNETLPERAQTLTPIQVVEEAVDTDALTVRVGAEDIDPEPKAKPEDAIRLRAGETGKSRDDKPVGRQWRSEIPGNPNQLLRGERNRPDVTSDAAPAEE